ncbi:CPBP family intramembrane glutamic endopeptidase [Roseibium sp. SCP14]|uniref:CPBP family intramembrane glutamic endopeptidase n=1 Tax=Roseibium sp. SCP14 TaxID=3141375 RepID=UPI003337A5B1
MQQFQKQTGLLRKSRLLLVTELAVLVAGPVLLMGLPVQVLRFSAVFLLAGYCFWRLKTNNAARTYLRFNWPGCHAAIPGILLRCFVGSAAIAAIVLAISPERLFCIPRADPVLMLLIVAFYGLISVLPQEIAFRGYAAWRLDAYNIPFAAGVVLSSALFGWVHILFGSWLSVGLSFAAGLSFYRTYRKYDSLAAVWLEHSLIGIAIFAIGLDHLFYLGPTPEAFASVCSATAPAN